MKKLSFNRRVQAEVNEAVQWYEQQLEGLGDDFFDKFSEALRLIATRPESFSFWLASPTVRRVKLKRFPYDILFEIRASTIKVTCLRHEKRHPNFGMGRQ